MQRLANIHKRTGKTSAGLSAMQLPTKKPQAPGVCYLQQTRSGQYIWSSQSIQEMDVALSEWPASQSDRLHIAETAIPVWHKYCKDAELSRRRHRK